MDRVCVKKYGPPKIAEKAVGGGGALPTTPGRTLRPCTPARYGDRHELTDGTDLIIDPPHKFRGPTIHRITHEAVHHEF